ncbi:MAG: hypothetical protein GXP52_08225 [Deltaproteobacteria bacterium]|nr:hypothetical protein [Deltaproteobacteria bacterium]
MKKVLILLVSAMVLLIDVPGVQAINLGAPVGFLDLGKSSISGSVGYAELDIAGHKVTSKSFMGKGMIGFSPKVTPYLKLGFADMSVDDYGFSGNLGFSYGGGVVFKLFAPTDSDFSLDLDTQLLWSNSSEGGQKFDLFQEQLTLLGIVKSGGTTGYAGFAVEFMTLDGPPGGLDENGRGFLVFGMDYFMDFNFYFSMEAHLFGEDAVSVGVGYRF